MLAKAHSPLINFDWNPISCPNTRLRHGRPSFFPLSPNLQTHASSFACLSMAVPSDATTHSEQSESSHNPQSQVTRSTVKFGRLKVQRVKKSLPPQEMEEQEEKKGQFEGSLESESDSDNVVSDSEFEVIRGTRASSPSKSRQPQPQLRRDFKPEARRRSAEAYSRPRGWGLYDPLEISQRTKSGNANEFFSRKSFRDVGCAEFMIECLRKQQFQRPSHIQAMAFAPVREGKSCILADQSGSGKTLAYLTPVIERLRQEEIEGVSTSASLSPRLVVLVPTAELASQVLGNCRSISKNGVPFRSMVVTGGFRQRTQLESLQQGVDVLVATPGRFMYLIKEGFLQLANLRCAVLDEVDILFNDEDFEPVLQNLINSSPVTTQYLFVTATLPVGIYNKLVELFPDCGVIMGPGMHRISAGLEEVGFRSDLYEFVIKSLYPERCPVLVDCSGGEETEKTPETAFLNKKSALLQLVEGNPVPKTIIFCNKIETCRKVENALKRFDRQENRVQVLPFHAAMTQELRLANIKEFTNSHPDKVSQFLVCTDRASRGMDFAGVNHVVLLDFPRDPSEYVRRVGRTARGAAGKGKAFIFVVGKQVSLARRIMERNQKGHPLHDVPSAYQLT